MPEIKKSRSSLCLRSQLFQIPKQIDTPCVLKREYVSPSSKAITKISVSGNQYSPKEKKTENYKKDLKLQSKDLVKDNKKNSIDFI